MFGIHQLHIYEELLLISLHETKGTAIGMMDQRFMLGAGILVELALANRIRMEGKPGREMIVVTDNRLTGDHLSDAWFDKIRSSKKPQSVATWLVYFTQDSDLRDGLLQRLWLAGLIKREERRVLLFFTLFVYPLNHVKPKQVIRSRVEEALLSDSPVDPRTAALLLIADSAGLLGKLVDPALVKKSKARLKTLAAGSSITERPDVVILAARMRAKG